MLNFILGFMSGVYLGTYHNETCKPVMNRIIDCMKKEYDNSKNYIPKDSKDDKDNE
jgi:hypothetical protein